MQENNNLMNEFLNEFNKKLDIVTPMSDLELSKLKEELSNMSPEEVTNHLKNMFNIGNQPYKRLTPKFTRNELCFCGSGKKYKNCCMEEFESYVSTLSKEDIENITLKNESDNTNIEGKHNI